MKVVVMGAGAVGSLLGSYLRRGGIEVVFVDLWKEHVKKVNYRGLTLLRPTGREIMPLTYTTEVKETGRADLILFAVKSYDTRQAARDCKEIMGPKTVVLSVQNGLGNMEILAEVLGKECLLAGNVTFGCVVEEAGVIRSSGSGMLSMGELSGEKTTRLLEIADAFRRTGMSVYVSEQMNSLLWTQLAVNAGINAIGAITGLTNGQIGDVPAAAQLQALAVAETEAVANASGIQFLKEDILAHVQEVGKNNYDHESSMLQDINRGVRTEVDAIHGAIVQEGNRRGVPTPINQSLALLVKTLEEKQTLPKG